MISPASEQAEQMQHEDLWDARQAEVEKAMLCSVIEHYSGMDAGRALEAYFDSKRERGWDVLLERSE